jgi:hypothetical protein
VKLRTNYGPRRPNSAPLNAQPWTPAISDSRSTTVYGRIWGSRGREFKSRQPDQVRTQSDAKFVVRTNYVSRSSSRSTTFLDHVFLRKDVAEPSQRLLASTSASTAPAPASRSPATPPGRTIPAGSAAPPGPRSPPPPSASITATSANTRPGRCAERLAPPTCSRLVEELNQPRRGRNVGQQPGPDMRDDTPPSADTTRGEPATLHHRSAFPWNRSWTLNTPRIAHWQGTSSHLASVSPHRINFLAAGPGCVI